MKVHILATCLNSDILDGTLLVFKTLRVGFPTAEIIVWGNGLSVSQEKSIKSLCKERFISIAPTTHDAWIEGLLNAEHEPFWICDTDVIFYDCVENWKFKSSLAGRFESAFIEPWTKSHKVARLHTCLMWMDAPRLRVMIRDYIRRWHPKNFIFNLNIELIRQYYVPQGADKPPLFYDTCAGLYQALGGQAFSADQNAAFDHLHCGTYSDRIDKVLPGFLTAQKEVFNDNSKAKDLRTTIENFYTKNSI